MLAGRISVRVGDRIDSGSVRWSRNANEETIGFYTPLGSQVAEFKRTAAGVSLIRGLDRQDSASVAELTEALFGVAIDLDLLARLVQGADALQTRWVSADGREWRLQAEEFSAAGPHRHARRVSIESGDARVRLVIDEWQAL
ncbi:MAG TPA: outer membrane lipoprotein LolB [Usitatibacteraceae bacterium]|nr:outer membrane lipoprotein LolB [Usitatibacteraceae bacterium]